LLLRSGMTIEKARSWVARAKVGELHNGHKMQKNGAVIAELTSFYNAKSKLQLSPDLHNQFVQNGALQQILLFVCQTLLPFKRATVDSRAAKCSHLAAMSCQRIAEHHQ